MFNTNNNVKEVIEKMQLSQKERMLLEDQKSHEEMCIKKYSSYAQQAQDPQLKQLFNDYASQEQQHLDTIQQILNGQVPNTSGQQGQQAGQQGQQNSGQGSAGQQGSMNLGAQGFMQNQNDAVLCQDALMTEKYVSGAYNTTIFECTDTTIRQVLNHIQKEEQQHGEGIFNYMRKTGHYTVQ